MSSLLELYNELSEEQQENLGKGGSKINTAGAHLVTITGFTVIDSTRVKVDFKNAAGQTIDYTGFLTSKDASKQEAVVNRVMGILARLCTAAGADIKKVLSKSTTGTIEYKSGTVPTEEYPTVVGKKLYIITNTIIEADDKDQNKAWVNQQVDTRHFFDTQERSGLEISSGAETGSTMQDIANEAKTQFEIGYKSQANKACQTKLAQLQGDTTANTAAGSTEDIDDDDI